MSKKVVSRLNESDDINSIFEDSDGYNSYYESVSIFFRVISFALFAILLIFVIISAFVGAEAFSYSNLDYIARNFALSLEENKDSTQQPIRYNPDPMNQFGLFGEGLAVCGSSALSIYSATGRQTCSEIVSFRKPVMVSSDKYVLIYDEGSGGYSLYNSFASVYNDILSHPIRDAAVADNGYYALLSSSEGYNSVVEIFNSDFSLINRYNKTGYVSCMDITDSSVLIVTADAETGKFEFNIQVLISAFGMTEENFSVNISAGFPLRCKITSRGVVVVCTDSVWFFDKSGNIIDNYMFDGKSLSDFVISSTNVLLLFKSKTIDIEYEVVCLDSYADLQYQNNISETVFDIDMYEDRAFVLTETSILCYEGKSIQTVSVAASNYDCHLYVIDKNKLYYCSDTYADVLVCFS